MCYMQHAFMCYMQHAFMCYMQHAFMCYVQHDWVCIHVKNVHSSINEPHECVMSPKNVSRDIMHFHTWMHIHPRMRLHTTWLNVHSCVKCAFMCEMSQIHAWNVHSCVKCAFMCEISHIHVLHTTSPIHTIRQAPLRVSVSWSLFKVYFHVWKRRCCVCVWVGLFLRSNFTFEKRRRCVCSSIFQR